MIFVGDIALPKKKIIKINDLPSHLQDKKWLANLEGPLLGEKEITSDINGVYNNYEAIRELNSHFDIAAFTLANNHILDSSTIKKTIQRLNDLDIPYVGAGVDSKTASESLIIREEHTDVVILNFGWEVIQCPIANTNREGVNPLTKKNVIQQVKKSLSEHPNKKIICIMHWGYELESEPQPFERELAKKIIDIGVDGVIGAHSHRIGGIEIYKGAPIVYSLGNWLFKQNYYYDGKVMFPDFCSLQLAFEWDFNSNKIKFHFFKFDVETSALDYCYSEDITGETLLDHTPFNNLNSKDYSKWYRKNHYHKNKGLPIYYWEDSPFLKKIKDKFNKIRDLIISYFHKRNL